MVDLGQKKGKQKFTFFYGPIFLESKWKPLFVY